VAIDGFPASQWIVRDYLQVVVHVFHRDKRAFYSLEDLWGDATRIEWETHRPSAERNLECADMSALWNEATCRVVESGDVSPHSKSCARLDAPTEPWRLHQPVLIRRFASRNLRYFVFGDGWD